MRGCNKLWATRALGFNTSVHIYNGSRCPRMGACALSTAVKITALDASHIYAGIMLHFQLWYHLYYRD